MKAKLNWWRQCCWLDNTSFEAVLLPKQPYWSRLSSLVVLAAVTFFAATLSKHVTLGNLPLIADWAGWTKGNLTIGPVFWLTTLPLRILSPSWMILALNATSALLAAGVLALMARFLELAPWNRPLSSMGRWAVLPVFLGCAVCGFQFQFWREATNATGEMLQLFFFALPLTLLMLFVRDRREGRLLAAGFVWGLGMVENWVMFYTVPLFLFMVISCLGWFLLSRRILMRLTMSVTLGLGFGFLLLSLKGIFSGMDRGLLLAWHDWFFGHKHFLDNAILHFWQVHSNRVYLLVLGIYFLLPIVPWIVRWHDRGTDTHLLTERFQVWMHRLLGIILLLAMLWSAFDPEVGLRQILAVKIGLKLPLLTYSYLLGLGAAFLAGNWLLAAAIGFEQFGRFPDLLESLFHRFSRWLFLLLLLASASGLIYFNFPVINLANQHPLTEFGKVVCKTLPVGEGIVLSDDPVRLLVFQAACPDESRPHWLALNTRLLANNWYRQQLAARKTGNWATNSDSTVLPVAGMIRLVDNLSRSNTLIYLHPAVNFLSDTYYFRPHGLFSTLQEYSLSDFCPPSLTPETIKTNEAFWDAFLPSLANLDRKQGDMFLAKWAGRPIYSEGLLLREWYAAVLNEWGVQLQRAGLSEAAQKRFHQALGLNPDNSAVKLNLTLTNDIPLEIMDGLATAGFNDLSAYILLGGPIDTADFCRNLGMACTRVGLTRMGVQQYIRAWALDPDDFQAPYDLAGVFLRCGNVQRANAILNHLKFRFMSGKISKNQDTRLSILESQIWLSLSNQVKAVEVMRSLTRRYPDDSEITSVALRGFALSGDYDAAIQLADKLSANEPDNLYLVQVQGELRLLLKKYDTAIRFFDRVLERTNLPAVRLLRAQAALEAGSLADARSDAEKILATSALSMPANLLLAEVNLREKNTNAALFCLQRCLTNLPPGSQAHRSVVDRIKSINGKSSGQAAENF